MTTLQVKCFLALYEELNFRKAAEKLFISQPHISRQIAALEAELNTPLFFRTSHSVKATAAATLLLNDFSMISNLMDSVQRKAAICATQDSQSLTLGTDSAFLMTPLIEALNEYRMNNLNALLRISGYPYAKYMEMYDNFELDAVMTFRMCYRNRPDENCCVVEKKRLVLAVHRKNAWYLKNSPMAISDCSSATFSVLKTHRSPHCEYNPITVVGADPVRIQEVDNLMEIYYRIERGNCAGIVPEIDRIKYNPSIIKFPLEGDGGDIIIMYKQENYALSLVRGIVEFINKYNENQDVPTEP